ncbi:hypothetical protein ABL78_7509 [Leptomonas seymouri]|uniref:Uncharacterized protein n=1 Tax=Leptomonas seymouri TaxID=5684 RepID=A0A0N1IH30_LEPSE|nr:hypothetical protein ABL78_7509 [Leptomonas seymouri]|eukprot:KPI83453.1 hypothetical protein ABL78_7509 [Leptomonas seymouri]
MKALVLCDGSEGSLRCLEVACAAPPKSANADASLVLLHVWNSPPKRVSTAISDSSARRTSARLSLVASTAQAVSEAISASANLSTNQASTALSASMSCGEVLTATLNAFHTNKYVRGRAHYCVETICSSTLSEGTEESSSDIVKAPNYSAQDKSGTAARHLSFAPFSTNPAAAAALDLEEDKDSSTNVVMRHAASGAARHQVDAVFLGVGQRQEGKTCCVGNVALSALRRFRTHYPLYFIKKDGVKWRTVPAAKAAATTTAVAAVSPIRFTIVVPISTPATSRSSEEGSNTEAQAHADTLSNPVKIGIEAAAHYVQQHCMRTAPPSASAPTPASLDSIAFLLIAPSSATSEEGGAVAEADADAAAAELAAPPAHEEASIVEVYKQYLETLLPKGAADVSDSAPQKELHDVEETNKVSSDTSPAGAPSRIAVCTLKASKKHHHVSLENTEVALPQVMKKVGAMKPQVLVLPVSLVPEALQLAMLSASKPHCVTLPY